MFDAASETRIIKPDGSGVVIPATPYRPRQAWGRVKIGDILPWNGVWFAVVAIAARNEQDVLVTLKPMKVTTGAMKKANGKKGKK